MEFTIKHFSELTAGEFHAIARVREGVFVVEQACPYPELDGKDENAWHVWLHDENGIAAYLRVMDYGVSFPDAASIGRVLSLRRRQGLGTAILRRRNTVRSASASRRRPMPAASMKSAVSANARSRFLRTASNTYR